MDKIKVFCYVDRKYYRRLPAMAPRGILCILAAVVAALALGLAGVAESAAAAKVTHNTTKKAPKGRK
jgi:hypothetical protein